MVWLLVQLKRQRSLHPNEPEEPEEPGEGGIETFSSFPTHTGGGWYELSNGEKVQGKDTAIEAEKALKGGE